MGDIVGKSAEGKYPPLPDNFLFNHSATRGGDDALHDHINDDLEVPINYLTDAQVCMFNFFERLANYLNGSCISNHNCKAVELAIFCWGRNLCLGS